MKHFLRKGNFLIAFLLLAATAQAQKLVKGKIINEAENSPLPGAIILEKGTNNNTLSNLNGEFEIKVKDAESILVFSYVGMETREVKANREFISVNMQLKGSLKEVVVTALGVSREKKALGYAVSEVSGKELVGSGEANIIQGLAGKVAGVQVTSSGGTPGASSKINIRGNQTFTGNNQPLIVVDGIPIDNTTFTSSGADNPYNGNLQGVQNSNRALDINPDDIESVTVLKGPAAAALYGQRAGTGAILYTTKKGKYKKGIGVTFSSSIEIQQVNKLPKLQNKYAQGYLDENGTPTYATADPGPDKLFDTPDDVDYGVSSSWGPEISKTPGLQSFDNNKSFFNTGQNYNNQLSIDGGTETTMYRFSISNFNSSGVIPNSKLNRTTVRLASEHKLTDKIKVGTSISYSNTKSTKPQNGSNLSGIMLGLLRMPASYDINNYEYDNGNVRTYFGLYDNPLYTAFKNPFNDNVNRVFGNTYINADPTKWLNITYKVGIDNYSDQRRQVYHKSSAGDDNTLRYGQVNYDEVNSFQTYSDLLVTGKKNFGKDIHTSLILGNNIWSSNFSSVFSRGRDLIIDDFYNLGNSIDRYASNSNDRIRTYAGFYNLEADWKSAIFLTLTGRKEWSSTFNTNKNSFFYPSANVSIVINELVKLPSWFDFFKVRGAIAQSGISPSPYKNRTYYTQPFFADGFTNGNSFPFLGQVGYGISNIKGSPNLLPERVLGKEIGTELKFFRGKLGFDVTYYNQKTVDILLDKPVAPSSGFKREYVNSGEMRNQGWEIAITATPVERKNFKWTISGTYYRNRSEVLKLADGVKQLDIEEAFEDVGSFAVVGQPYGTLFGSAWQRNADGKLIIDPSSGLPYIDPVRKALGSPFPDFLAGLRNSFTIGQNFNISFLWDFRKGGKIWNGTYARLNRLGRTEESGNRDGANATYVIDGVLGTGTVNPDGTAVAGTAANNVKVSAYDYFRSFKGDAGGAVEEQIQDGSWARLREVSASYRLNFKPNAAGKKIIQYLDFNFTAINLLLFTKYKGVDPETSLTGAGSNIQGFDYFNNPGVKTFTFGIRAGF
jgi:TonB-linked SusC/RagA family outer membrane protein